MKKTGRALLAIAAIAVAALFACGGGESVTSSGAGGAGSSRSGAAVSDPARPLAPDFTLDAVRAAGDALVGTKFKLSDRAGDVSVLYFSFVG